jgi:D-glycero-D-manno-heptose 1,7-bisphosphate phosphatase
MTGRQRAAFIDRDGVLNVDHGYVYRVEDFEWLPGAVQALRQLQAAGYALIVVTNQSGIARGMYTEADLACLHRFVDEDLQRQGVRLTGIYACPHHPQATLEAYRQDCNCRKPRPGLILRASAEHGLDLARSCLVGDKASDIEAGRAAGVGRCWLVGSPDAAGACAADGHGDSLAAAVTAQLGAAVC